MSNLDGIVNETPDTSQDLFLDECLEFLITEGFTEKWLNNLSQTNDKDVYVHYMDTIKRVYDYLHLSLLTGEYVEVPFNIFKKSLDNLESILTEKINIIEEYCFRLEEDNQSQSLPSTHDLRLAREPLKRYKEFARNIYHRLRNQDSIYLESTQDGLTVLEELFDNSNISGLFAYLQIFRIGLKLSVLDHHLSFSKKNLNELYWLSERLRNVTFKSHTFTSVYIDKCLFLKKKILDRFASQGKTIFGKFVQEQEDLKTIKYFTEFNELAEIHYGADSSDIRLLQKERMEGILEDGGITKQSPYKDFHAAIKFYKDVEPNLTNLENVRIKFTEKYKSENRKTLFNQRAVKTNYNYVLNNEISLLVNHELTTFKDVHGSIENLIDVQSNTNFKNYFPFEKVCRFINKKIEIIIKSDKQNLEELGILISALKKYLKILNKNFEWCLEKNIFLFQLPFEECRCSKPLIKKDFQILNHTKKTAFLFLASCFTFPISKF
ncbi:MAG: hypothetical protein V4642_13115 [Bacteroidota bacterium]